MWELDDGEDQWDRLGIGWWLMKGVPFTEKFKM